MWHIGHIQRYRQHAIAGWRWIGAKQPRPDKEDTQAGDKG
jgi:hypothetical protein